MNLQRYSDITIQSANSHGLTKTITVAIEELTECIQALTKYQRQGETSKLHPETAKTVYGKLTDHVFEEIADVYIMLRQVRHLLSCGMLVYDNAEAFIDKKIDRLEQRLADGTAYGGDYVLSENT
jgi:NTP pyrophosphatase (non-canonical NTP hydrolase)